MRALLSNRDARLFLAGQSLSAFGDSALWLALGIWIKMLTGSPSAAGLAFFVFTLGTLAAPLGGVLADRMPRRRLLVIANLVTAALVLPLLLVHDRGGVPLLYLVMGGYGLSAGVLGPAQAALLPTVVGDELLGDANSALQSAQWGLRLVTLLFGAGLLAAFGPAPVIVADAVTFLVATAALLALRIHEEPPAPAPQPPLAPAGQVGGRRAQQRGGGLAGPVGAQHGEVPGAALPRVGHGGRVVALGTLPAGARHIRATPALRQATVAGALAVTAFGLSETAFFAVVGRGLHRPDAFLGVLICIQGAGALAAGLIASALMRRLGERRLVALGLAGASTGFLLQAFASLPAVLAGACLVGAGLPWITVGIVTLFQRRTPAELLGRTNAALGLALSAPQALAIALGAALVAALDYRIVLAAVAVLTALPAGYLLTRPEQRPEQRPGRHPAPVPEQQPARRSAPV
ncbi:MFS transporter [Kitasatospora nipponensis]|uniref:MFS transporter n=1 Tax=Kitasatospora nipponensis TaxID=258049 RepID=A0ABN1WW05_9ACTN